MISYGAPLPSLMRVLPPFLARWERYIWGASTLFAIDPLIIAAILERESKGGELLTPKGAGGKGDKGNGHGLMQIDGRYHATFIAAVGPDKIPLWKKPEWNIAYGTGLLAYNLTLAGGDLEIAVAGYNCDIHKAIERVKTPIAQSSPSNKRNVLDALTTGNDYVSYVFSKADLYRSKASV